jgi:IS5 family transposase
MLRIYFLRQWFHLLDPQAEDMLHDSESMRRFAGIDLLHDTVPDDMTICSFHHSFEAHQLTSRMFDAVKALIKERTLLLKAGTLADARIIRALSSTRNATQTRDTNMREPKKGSPWRFGMKMRVGTDRRGMIATIMTTDVATTDSTAPFAARRGNDTAQRHGGCVLHGRCSCTGHATTVTTQRGHSSPSDASTSAVLSNTARLAGISAIILPGQSVI